MKKVIGTVNSLASKFDEFKPLVSWIFDILIKTEKKLHNTFPTSQFYIEGFLMPYRLDRNKNGGGKIIYVRKTFPLKSTLPEDIEGIFVEINFQKTKSSLLLLCGIITHLLRMINTFL